jgi:hypothetical protein
MTQKTQTAPNLKIKGSEPFRHDLYKAGIARMKRNMSWKKGEVLIQEIEHVHFYHSVNSRGRPQRYTGTVGAHFHEVEWSQDEKGNLVAKCGKPLTHRYRQAAGRQKKFMSEVKWYDEEKQQDVVDTHVHDMTYVHTEFLSQETVRQAQQGAAAQLIEQQKMQQAAKDVGLEGAT